VRPDLDAIRARLAATTSQDWPAGKEAAFRIAALQFHDYRDPTRPGWFVFGCTAGFSTFMFQAGADMKALLDYVDELEGRVRPSVTGPT
jgi:hypothetical protein